MDDPAEHPSVKALPARWVRDLRAAGASASDAELARTYDAVAAHYGEPARHHHTLSHIAAVLAQVDELLPVEGEVEGEVEDEVEGAPDVDRPAVVLAAWLHDVIYDPTRADNEAASAVWAADALSALGVDDRRIEDVRRLILATAHHEVDPADVAGAILIDADLAILGASPDTYARYAEAVRAEYHHVPDDAFAAGRAAVLESFLARPRLFHTDAMQARLDAPARANLRTELDGLRKVAAG